jgi:Hemerythrin HHE cation binding domain
VDITQLILDDHHEQRRLFAVLEQIDPADTGTLSAVWARLAAFLEVHAAAEEAIFYPELLRVGRRANRLGATEEETLDAIGDHNEIRDSIAEVAKHAVGSDEWLAAVAAVNQANGDHMAEEEREGLTDFRREATVQRRHDLAVAFAGYEARHVTGVQPVDRDPQAYVREVEESDAPDEGPPDTPEPGPPSGSLGIGSLRGTPAGQE